MAPTALAADTPTLPPSTDVRRVLIVGLGLAALLTLLLAAFTWPPSELEPRSLPVAVVAPTPEAAAAAQQGLDDDLAKGAIDVLEVDDRAAAVAAIEEREAYGALVMTPEGTEVLTATAAGPQVAQLLGQAAAAADRPTTTTDVVPAPAGDPRGAVFNAGALPLAIGGIMIGAVTSLALGRTRDRLATVGVVGIVGGLALAGVLQGWLDAIGGDYLANAGVIGLGLLAVALPIVGLRHLIGVAGVGIVALVVLLIGNPLSGVTSAPELLPLGRLGQLLPPGAVGTALRGTAFFDGAGTLGALLVLACWSAAGLAVSLIPRRETAA